MTPTPKQLPPLWVPGFLDPSNAGQSLASVLSGFLSLIFIIGGLTAFITFLIGALSMITSGGEAQKLADGRNKIMWALIGLIILLASWAIIMLFEKMLGFCLGFACPIDLSEFSPGN